MSAQRESRQAGNLTAENPNDEATTTSVKPNVANPSKPIGYTVESHLDAILWQLILGDVELYQLTPALAAWWTLARESGCKSRQPEIDRLEHTADRLYAEVCRRPGVPFIDPNRPSYVQLEQTRAEIYGGAR